MKKGLGLLLFVVPLALCVGVTAASARLVEGPNAIEAAPPLSLWVGDSYTMGSGSTEPWIYGEAYAATRMFGWGLALDAIGGTGFVSPSQYGPPVPDRLKSDAATWPAPDIVVIDAGRNDYSVAEDVERQAVLSYFRRVAHDFPKAKVVVVTPFAMRSPRGDYLAMRCMLASQARSRGWSFVDPLSEGWVNKTAAMLTISNGSHPDSAGYVYVVDHLVPAISNALMHPHQKLPRPCTRKAA